MFIEYLFSMNPATFFFLILGTIFLVSFLVRKESKIVTTEFEETSNDFKLYRKLQDSEKEKSILVLQYNILSHNFTRVEWFPNCQPEYLNPKYRSPRIMNEIEKVKPDIITFQECDYDLFGEYYIPYLKELGYSVMWNVTKVQKPVTNAVAYKKKSFSLEKFEYLDLNDALGKVDESFLKHKEALFLQLKHLSTGRSVLAATTHLFWNPEFEYIKYGQMSIVTSHIEKNYPNIPFILGGDLNSLPDSNVLKYVYKEPPQIEGKTDEKKKMLMDYFWKNHKHNLEMRSAYDIYKVASLDDYSEYGSNHPEFTTITHEFQGTLDYIFYSSDKFEVAELLRIPCNDEELKMLKLPNYRFPSDHLKIGARLTFK